MVARFIGKNIRKKVVRVMKNSDKYRNYSKTDEKTEEVVAEEVKEQNIIETVTNKSDKEEQKDDIILSAPKKENKRQKRSKKMVNENKLTQMEAILNGDIPSRNVKVEKSDKGLFERTENSTILLTEDNKMLLND